jgi:hypothetical protein
VHDHRLVGRNDLVLVALQQQNRAVERVDAGDRAPGLVGFLIGGIGPDEAVEVPGLELVRVLGQEGEIGDPVQRAPRPEDVSKGEGAQGRVSAGGAPVDAELFSVGQALVDQVLCPVANIVDIDNSPALAETPAVVPSVAGRSSVIDV